MRTKPTTATMILITLLLMTSMLGGGCSLFVSPAPLTPQDHAMQEVRQAQTAYLVAVTTISALRASGKISDDAMKAILPLEQTVYAYLQAATTAAQEGRTVDVATQMKLFNEALQRFVQATVPAPTP